MPERDCEISESAEELFNILIQFWFFMAYFLHICYIPSEL